MIDDFSKEMTFLVFAISLFYISLNLPYKIITLFLASIFFNESEKRILPKSFVIIKKQLLQLKIKKKEIKEWTKDETNGVHFPVLTIIVLFSFLFIYGDSEYFHMIIFMLVFGSLEYANEKYLRNILPTKAPTKNQRKKRNSDGVMNTIIYRSTEMIKSFCRRIIDIDYKTTGIIFSIFLLYYFRFFEFFHDQNTLYWFYSTIAQSFAAILSIIIAMYSVMVWRSGDDETIGNFVPGFKGFAIIFILIIVSSLVGMLIKSCPTFEEPIFDLSTLSTNRDAIQNLLGIGIFEITLLLIPAALIYFHALIAAFLEVHFKRVRKSKKRYRIKDDGSR